jgi:uncharacterized protein
MKIFFYFGHPSQFHFNKNIIRKLKETGNDIHIYIKSKDVLETLLKDTGWPYINIQQVERGKSKVAILTSLLKRDFFLSYQVIKHKPDLLVASDPSFSHIGYFFGIPSLNFMDDDFDAAGYYASITYPFTETIITPHTVKMGKWEHKRISYKGYMKLAYLHPKWFVPDETKIGNLISKSYFLVRLSGLQAHHDSGKRGINPDILKTIIDKLSLIGRVIISAEGKIDPEFKKYKSEIPAVDMHHFLYHAKLLISDSQSMTGEAAVMGVPSLRISSFKGKLSVLEELEQRFELSYSFYPDEINEILHKVDVLIEMTDLHEVFHQRRRKMLEEKIDVTSFCTWFIENYPGSKRIMQENPEFAERFK